MLDPTADNTDVYAFTAPDAPHSLTVVANWIPLEDPAGGPYFGKLDPRARYYVKIDNTGDGREDVAYRWKFTNEFRNPNSFLDAAPTVDSVDDPDINFVQRYDLYKETYKHGHRREDHGSWRNDVPVGAGQHGPEDGAGLRQGAGGRDHARCRAAARRSSARPTIRSSSTSAPCSTGSTSTSRAGPNIGLGNQGGGKDDVAGYNTHSFVLQVPESEVTRDGKSVADMKSAQRRGRRVGHDGAPARQRAAGTASVTASGGCRSAASATR